MPSNSGNRLSGSVVVVTGASSGIGRGAALEFARRGAHVVLAARSLHALRKVATECQECGGHALPVAVDVGVESQVEELAQRAVSEFGRIDVWVNVAAVVTFGRFLDVPSHAFERVVRTNFFGTVHGSRAALTRFRHQLSTAFEKSPNCGV